MDNQQQYQNPYSDEIDLVDLAAVVYRRKATLSLTVLISIVLAIGYWFSIEEKQRVSAVFKIGEEVVFSGISNMVPLMTAEDSEQLLKMVYLPILIQSIELETGIQNNIEGIEIKYTGSVKHPTSVLELFAEVPQKKVQTIIAIINGSLNLLLKNHNEKLNEYKTKINNGIEIQRSQLLILSKFSTPENPLEVINRQSVELSIISLESLLASSTNSTIVKSASAESVKSGGPAKYFVGGFVFGLFFGCFVVFFLELYAKAKVRSSELS